ncbi:TOPRS ligase, partial [Pelecanoides urinatrix]|nr:TOPRS ligase [Pelecanoides urinatrix]
MEDESAWSCPVCRDDEEDVTYMSPCLHKFCLGCAVHWAWQKANYPLCRSVTTAILFLVRADDDYLTFDVPGPAEPSPEDRQDEQGAAGPQQGAEVGGFPPEVWAAFFRSHPDNVRSLLLWLRREIGVLVKNQWWQVALGEANVVGQLLICGLDEEMLVRQLQSSLRENTGTFIRQLIATALRLCGREIRRHLGQQDPCAAAREDDSPAAGPSPTASQRTTPDSSLAASSSPAASDAEEEAGTSEDALRWGPGRPSSAPVPAEQEQPQEEPGELAGVAGPSAPGWGRGRSATRPQHAPKRRAPSPQDSPQPCKRPPPRRH